MEKPVSSEGMTAPLLTPGDAALARTYNPLVDEKVAKLVPEQEPEKICVRCASQCHTHAPRHGNTPSNAITTHPQGRRLSGTFFGDTPAPFECPCCTYSGLTNIRSTMSSAAMLGAAVTIVGLCFLLPGGVLWHKDHHCPACDQKVGEHKKDDIFLFADPMSWHFPSFAIPS